MLTEPSYHQLITEEEAERRLKQYGGHCYLTRCNQEDGCFMLSVFEYRQTKYVTRHFWIKFEEDGKKSIAGFEMKFGSISSLLEHYEQNELNSKFHTGTIGQAYTEAEYKQNRDRQEQRKKILGMFCLNYTPPPPRSFYSQSLTHWGTCY